MPLVWMFVKSNWKLIVIGLAIAALMGYIGFLKLEVSHYKTKYEDAQLVIAEIHSKEEAQKAAAAAITRKYENSQAAYKLALAELGKKTQEKIANDTELANTRVSLNALRLFNESKQGGDTAPAVQGHAGETSGTSQGPGTTSLTTIFAVSAKNDENHLRCVKQVEEWQNFWRDYESSVQVSRQVKSASP